MPRLAVNAAHDFIGLFYQRSLVLAHWNKVSLEPGDIGRLRYGVAEKARRNIAPKTAGLDLFLDRGIAFEARDGNEVHVKQGQSPSARKAD